MCEIVRFLPQSTHTIFTNNMILLQQTVAILNFFLFPLSRNNQCVKGFFFRKRHCFQSFCVCVMYTASDVFLFRGVDEMSIVLFDGQTTWVINVTDTVSALTFEPIEQRIYYATTHDIYIYSQKLNGSDERREVSTGQ